MMAHTVKETVQAGSVNSLVNCERLVTTLLDTKSHTPAGRAAHRRSREYLAHVGPNYVYASVIEPLDRVQLAPKLADSKATALIAHPGSALPTLLIQEGCAEAVVELVKMLDRSGIQFVVNVPRSSNLYDAESVRYITQRVLSECSGNVSIPCADEV